MAEVEANCECQYTLTLTGKVVHGKPSEMKDNFNHAPNIHEVVEEDTDEEYINDQQNPPPTPPQEQPAPPKDSEKENEDEESYTCESFCSDDSCDEIELTDATQKSVSSATREDESKSTRRSSCRTMESRFSLQDSEEEEEEEETSTCDESSFALRHVRSRRKNMTFTDEEIRKIERENHLLLKKIMAQQKPRDHLHREKAPEQRTSSSAINRKKFLRKIEYDNMLMLQRIQQAKSRVMGTGTKPGCRLTFL